MVTPVASSDKYARTRQKRPVYTTIMLRIEAVKVGRQDGGAGNLLKEGHSTGECSREKYFCIPIQGCAMLTSLWFSGGDATLSVHKQKAPGLLVLDEEDTRQFSCSDIIKITKAVLCLLVYVLLLEYLAPLSEKLPRVWDIVIDTRQAKLH
jgi:hypothetical protein